MDKNRLFLEHQAMMERWSAMQPKLRAADDGNRLWWELELRAEDNHLPIRIEYPANYPASPPDIVIVPKMPSGTPHLLPGNRMCWYYPSENQRNRNMWCPATDTGAMCVGVAQRWFWAFLVWLSTSRWPVPDAIKA